MSDGQANFSQRMSAKRTMLDDAEHDLLLLRSALRHMTDLQNMMRSDADVNTGVEEATSQLGVVTCQVEKTVRDLDVDKHLGVFERTQRVFEEMITDAARPHRVVFL